MGIKVNIGCGPKRTQYNGYINCDKDSKLQPDLMLDVTKYVNTEGRVLPWSDNQADEIRCENLFDSLEHEVSTRLIREIYRVLRSGGQFHFHCGDSAVNPAMCLGSWPYFKAPYTELFFRHFELDHDAHKNWRVAWELPGFINVDIQHNDNGVMIGVMVKP